MSTKAQHSVKYRVIPVFLRELRESANLTQRDIGKILNKPQSYIHNCEVANRRVDITEFIACLVILHSSFTESQCEHISSDLFASAQSDYVKGSIYST